MTKRIGLWIDHRQAVIITLTDDGADKTLIKSNVERHARAAGAPELKGPFKARMIPADDRHEREFTDHLKIYYNRVIDRIGKAESVLIFGPGEAKKELKKQMQKNDLGGLIVSVQTADKMTDNQILSKVCKYYNVSLPPEFEVESPHQRMKRSSPEARAKQI